MIKATINNVEVEVPEGTTILWAAKKANFNIPTLCHHPDLTPGGQCGLCVVEIEGIPGLKRSCMTPIGEGWKVHTHTARLMAVRRQLVDLILSNHDTDCLTCMKNNNCELQQLASTLGMNAVEYHKLRRKTSHRPVERLHREGPEQMHSLRSMHTGLLQHSDGKRPGDQPQGVRFLDYDGL